MRWLRTPLTLLGLILGLAGGLVYSWVLSPLEYTDTAPASLRQDFKEDYLGLIASAYAATGDLNRVRSRLALLGLIQSPEEISRLAQNRLAAGYPESEAQALAQLAAVLGERPLALVGATPSPQRAPQTASPSDTPFPTATAPLTATPSRTPGAPFALIERTALCLPEPQIQVRVLDASGEGVPGVGVRVVWDEGLDRFYTGLKPELGAGYADFSMDPEAVYSLQLLDGQNPVTGLSAGECRTPDGELRAGSWLLVFQQPAAP